MIWRPAFSTLSLTLFFTPRLNLVIFIYNWSIVGAKFTHTIPPKALSDIYYSKVNLWKPHPLIEHIW